MKIEKNKVVGVTYKLRTDGFDSDIIEEATEKNPLRFIFGNGMMLPKFESNLAGLSEGDEFSFSLEADDAYGKANPDLIIEIPKSSFENDGKIEDGLLEIGNVITMQDSTGQRYDGTVLEVGEGTVKMDFNHPMANKSLYFTGKVIEVRDASEEELAHGHVH